MYFDFDYYQPKIFKRGKTLIGGVGVNDMDLSTKIVLENGKVVKCPVYDIWRQMLLRETRDYQEKYPHYKGTTVCQEWKYRSNFYNWMEQNNWKEGICIDKDILDPYNKQYHPEKCTLVPIYINSLLTDRKNHERNWPLGVSKENTGRAKCYVGQCNIEKKRSVRLGRFHTPEEAHQAYQLSKSEEIKRVAEKSFYNKEITLAAYEALIKRYEKVIWEYENGLETKSIHHY